WCRRKSLRLNRQLRSQGGANPPPAREMPQGGGLRENPSPRSIWAGVWVGGVASVQRPCRGARARSSGAAPPVARPAGKSCRAIALRLFSWEQLTPSWGLPARPSCPVFFTASPLLTFQPFIGSHSPICPPEQHGA